MIPALIVSQILSWLLIAGLGVALLALARQVGVLHVRVAPSRGTLTSTSGPAVGRPVGIGARPDRPQRPAGRAVGKPSTSKRLQLLMFVSPVCPICKTLIPVAKSFAKKEDLEVVFMGDDPALTDRLRDRRHGHRRHAVRERGRCWPRSFHVDKLPHAGADRYARASSSPRAW